MNPLMFVFQVEADLGYPGGKAKIIHKESDIIMAFAINKVSYVFIQDLKALRNPLWGLVFIFPGSFQEKVVFNSNF